MGELRYAVALVGSTAIGEKDEGDAEALEGGESTFGARKGVGGAKEDAVDAGGGLVSLRGWRRKGSLLLKGESEVGYFLGDDWGGLV